MRFLKQCLQALLSAPSPIFFTRSSSSRARFFDRPHWPRAWYRLRLCLIPTFDPDLRGSVAVHHKSASQAFSYEKLFRRRAEIRARTKIRWLLHPAFLSSRGQNAGKFFIRERSTRVCTLEWQRALASRADHDLLFWEGSPSCSHSRVNPLPVLSNKVSKCWSIKDVKYCAPIFSYLSQAFTVTYCYHHLGNFSAMLPRTNASCSGVSFLFLPHKYLLFPGILSFTVIMRWTIAVETLQRSAISINLRFVVVLRAWTETFVSSGIFFLSAMLFMGSRALIWFLIICWLVLESWRWNNLFI